MTQKLSDWHALEPHAVTALLDVNPQSGLTASQVNERVLRYGRNALQQIKSRPAWRVLIDQFASIVIALLAFAAAVAWLTGDGAEAIAILIVLVLNGVIGFVTEWQAGRALDALRRQSRTSSRVRRDNFESEIDAEELVRGDIVILNAGDRVPADARLLEAVRLETEESALTGESTTVEKDTTAVGLQTPLAERRSMVYLGTAIAAGHAVAVVVSTGTSTQLGKIGKLVATSTKERSPLEIQLANLGRHLVYLVLVVAAIVMVTGWWRGDGVWLMVEVGISLAVAAVPESLPAVTTLIFALGVLRMARQRAIMRRLSAVETLGSTTVICADKTGTLTENRMTVREYYLSDSRRVEIEDSEHSLEDDELLRHAVRVGVLCNEASFRAEASDESRAVGDPTETALLVVADTLVLDVSNERAIHPKVTEQPFQTSTKRMTTLHRKADGQHFAALKGAPAVVLDACSHYVDAAGSSVTPDRPVMRGTAQNPDVFFQSRERANSFYLKTPAIVEKAMERFAALTGRRYQLFEFVGDPEAERVVVMMGSGCETAEETVETLTKRGKKVGLLKVRLYRPFSIRHFIEALPASTKAIAVLDRTKEPGGTGEPLYQDVVTALAESSKFDLRVVGGRNGLSSKEFTPAMVEAVFDELNKPASKNHFSIGIDDDVTFTSIPFDESFSTEPDDQVRAVFWGLGADGTVSANKNSIKIIGEETPNYAQGYFVYDSKKAGAMTVSHLRFGPRPIKSTYLIQRANFVAVHQFPFFNQYDILATAAEDATLLINSPYEDTWEHLPSAVQKVIIEKRLKVYAIDATGVARESKLGNRINTIMQTCFFALSGVLPREEAITKIKQFIRKSYGKRGEPVVRQNFAAVDAALAHLREIAVPETVNSTIELKSKVPLNAPEFVRNVTAEMIAGRGDLLPVSAFPEDGTYPVGTTRWEKRNIAQDVPVWESDICIECGKCVMVCPHATIRAKVCSESDLKEAPAGFKYMPAKWREFPDKLYTIQVALEDCTGCRLCVEVCPAKDKSNMSRKALNMQPQLPLRDSERVNWDYFLTLPDLHKNGLIAFNSVKNVQLLQPLFEFSGACAGCGETPYIKLLTQLFGDRAIIANATGCSSIYGGNLPTTPYTTNDQGRGPAWSNSLFEDNAEFGLGMRLALDHQQAYARELLERLRGDVGESLVNSLLNTDQSTNEGINIQRELVAALTARIGAGNTAETRDLLSIADSLVEKSVWIVGGDGWAYDIGYGGLDHVLASGQNVNILVLDTEVYSNTGGQASKATPLGAVAKFATGGKPNAKKDLGITAIRYGDVYIAQVAIGANDTHTIKAFLEAEAHPGPSLIIAYSQCIAHGIDMAKGMHQQKLAVESGYWPLYRYNPRLVEENKNPFQLDSSDPKISLQDYIYTEGRYRMLQQSEPAVAQFLLGQAQKAVSRRWQQYKQLAQQKSVEPVHP